jgi:hypothetical protein
MLEPDEQTIKRLRAEYPHGRMSTNDIEQAALHVAVTKEIEKLEPGPLREILETMAALL